MSTKDEGLAGSQPDPETRRLRDLIRSLEVWEMFKEAWDAGQAGRVSMETDLATYVPRIFTIDALHKRLMDRAGLERTRPAAIYVASKIKHAHRWKELRAAGMPICATWIDEAGEGESASLEDLARRCVLEASTASALVLYSEPDDVLKGGLIEVGAALAAGVPVHSVGISANWSVTFACHPLWTVHQTLHDAFMAAWPEEVVRISHGR